MEKSEPNVIRLEMQGDGQSACVVMHQDEEIVTILDQTSQPRISSR
ncbi:hypothetical protein J2W30_006714 [Variovorax boronicumulans]|nr:hypothetical protein [Variovorax boronicumulans]